MKIAGFATRLRSRGGAFAHDLLVIPIAWLGALWLRFNLDSIPAEILYQALVLLPLIVVVQGSVFLYFGLYRGVWRFASMPDLVRIIQAVAVGVSLCAVGAFLLTRLAYTPRATFPLFAGLLVGLLGGPRLAYRWLKDRNILPAVSKRMLIVGAGRSGEALARNLLRDQSREYCPVGFVDDDPEKKGRDVHGVRILGHCGQMRAIVRRTGAEVIAVAIPSASATEMQRIVGLCERARVSIQTVPRMKEFLSDRSAPAALRPVAIEDLLDREPVQLDWPAIRNELTGRRILVTGGGGSIGSELCRQIARLEPSHLIVVDFSELNLHRIQIELRDSLPTLPLSMVLADICDEAAVERLFDRYAPEVVFHAAAYKQVPILESHMREAIRVNVLGTETVGHAAVKYAAERFVLVSSDKAVHPVNSLGVSKLLAEMVCRAIEETSPVTRFIAVRFGNVLDSAGSVVPLFREQIARGGPVTVTDPEMERYFMTIPEACQLVMASAVLGKGGEVFVLDMGEPVRIVYLAEQMIRLSGKTPGVDIAIEFIGSRPGEKLTEALFHSEEWLRPTQHDKIRLAHGGPVRNAELATRLVELRKACDAFDEKLLERIVSELVSGYFVEQAPAHVDFHIDSTSDSIRPAASSDVEPAVPAAENVIPIGQRKR